MILYLVLILLHSIPIIPNHRIDRLELESKIFDNYRTLRIYLPPGYSTKYQYKVLYLTDGQNVFKGEVSDNWKLEIILDSLINSNSIPPIIVVAIDNIGMQKRGNEYLPWEDIYLDPPIPNPEGKKFPAFLIDEVMPLIKENYCVKEGKVNTGIGGFSYGGLISAYTFITHPEIFGFAIIESPSFYVNNREILNLAKLSDMNYQGRIHLGVGTNEIGLTNCDDINEDNLMAVKDVLQFKNILATRNIKIEALVDSCATHSFTESSNRLPEAIKFCLKDS